MLDGWDLLKQQAHIRLYSFTKCSMRFHRLLLGITGILVGCFGVTDAAVGMAKVN
jgi:hypothetical protein